MADQKNDQNTLNEGLNMKNMENRSKFQKSYIRTNNSQLGKWLVLTLLDMISNKQLHKAARLKN